MTVHEVRDRTPGLYDVDGDAWFASLKGRGPLDIGEAPLMQPPLSRT